jgi:heat shock protein HslJ
MLRCIMANRLLAACTLALAVTACQDIRGTGLAPANVPAAVPANALAPVVTAAYDQLVGPVWQWHRTQLGSAPAVVAKAPDRYTLSFDGGGRVNVRADCNRGGGSYEVNGAAIRFGAIALTRMGCPPGSQDGEFLRSLVQATTFTVERGDLVLTLADGAAMRFRQAP